MKRLKALLENPVAVTKDAMLKYCNEDLADDLAEIQDLQTHKDFVQNLLAAIRKIGIDFSDEKMQMLNDKSDSFLSKNELSLKLFGLVLYDTNLPKVQALVGRGADVNIVGRGGDSLLNEAIRGNSWQTVTWLIEQGADVQQVNACLEQVAERGPLSLFKLMVDKGAQIDPKCINAALRRQDGKVKEFLDYIITTKGIIPIAQGNGYTPTLHAAINTGKEVMELLFSCGLNVDYQDREGRTALHKAVKDCKAAAFELLISKGADPTIVDNSGKMPIDYIIEFHVTQNMGFSGQFLKTLSKSKAKCKFPTLTFEQQINLLDCAYSSESNLANFFNEIAPGQSLFDLTTKDAEGMTLLHRACYKRRWYAARYLSSLGADLEAKDKAGNEPYKYANYGESVSLKQELIKIQAAAGTTPKRAASESQPVLVPVAAKVDVITPLHTDPVASNQKLVGPSTASLAPVPAAKIAAAETLAVPVVSKPEAITPSHTDPVLNSQKLSDLPFSVCILSSDPRAYAPSLAPAPPTIVAAGTSADKITQLSERLIRLVKDPSLNISEIARLIQAGAEINYKDKYMRTPFYYALDTDNLDAAFELLKQGADVADPKYLQTAAHLGDFDLIKAMLAKGATPSLGVLIDAIKHGHEMVKYFIDLGVKPIDQWVYERQVTNRDTKVVEIRPTYITPTLQCVSSFDIETMKLLLDTRLNVNYQDAQTGKTVLHKAVEEGSEKMVEFLLSKGAKVDIVDGQGKTPLDYLFPQKYAASIACNIARLLIVKGANFAANQRQLLELSRYCDDTDLIAKLEKIEGNVVTMAKDIGALSGRDSGPIDQQPLLKDHQADAAKAKVTEGSDLITTMQQAIDKQLPGLLPGSKKAKAVLKLRAAISNLPSGIQGNVTTLEELSRLVTAVINPGKLEDKVTLIAAFEEKHKPSIGHKIAAIIFGLVGAAIGAAIGFAGGAFLGGAIGPQAMASGLYGLAHGTYTGWAIGTACAMGLLAVTGGLTTGMGYYSFFGRSPLQETIQASRKAAISLDEVSEQRKVLTAS